MKIISSNNNKFVSYLSSLKMKKNRYENKQFIVEGWHLVQKALETNLVVNIFIESSNREKYLPLINNKDMDKIYLISKEILNKVCQATSPQPIFALCSFVEEKKIDLKKDILVLDNIQDPSNLGAILRSCAAFNCSQILISDNSADFYNYKVISASQGAIFNISVIYDDLVKKISLLKKENYFVYGTFLHQEGRNHTLSKLEFKNKNVLIFGNEGNGISENLKPLVDKNFIIETTDNVESLNLSISVAITLYNLYKDNI